MEQDQDRNLYNEETNLERERTHERKPQESATGRDLPRGDGDVGDEQVQAITDSGAGRPIGQDHSTDITADREPTDGVGGVQDSSQPADQRANINE